MRSGFTDEFIMRTFIMQYEHDGKKTILGLPRPPPNRSENFGPINARQQKACEQILIR